MPNYGQAGVYGLAKAPSTPLLIPYPEDYIRHPQNRVYGRDWTGAYLPTNYTKIGSTTVTRTNGFWGPEIKYTGTNGVGLSWAPPSGDFEMVVGMRGIGGDTHQTAYGNMPCLWALDSAGTGVGFGPYYSSAFFYGWNITTYGYTSSWTNNSQVPQYPGGHFWIRLRKVGTTYDGASSYDGITWNFTTTTTNAFTLAQIGIGNIWNAGSSARVLFGRLNVYPGAFVP